ncbi:ac120 [Peridroma alphabaculovirus]|uniref:Ac120 n=1 Tax=Peridroma alphabaculovirus TaxID=1346829 RepID=A0A068LKP8_9ABAC|nr:ac120 [Peridroma alphabaculovirus]AIE47763.1 ac120 [Peridroma alphabaculovirus]
MNNAAEALALAKRFEHLHHDDKAIACYELAIHFLSQVRAHQTNNHQVLTMLDAALEKCHAKVRELKLKRQKTVLKKYVLLK